MNFVVYNTYIGIMKEELVPAMGCTEPVAVAYCAAKARSILGVMPDKVTIEVSGNIIKNVKSVIVPHTGGLHGLEAAAAVGILYGQENAGLEVISAVTPQEEVSVKEQMSGMVISVVPMDSVHVLDIRITVASGEHYAAVHIEDEHTNIVDMNRDGVALEVERAVKTDAEDKPQLDYNLLDVAVIKEFADSVIIEDVQAILDRQIECNTAIATEGLKENYGARIGQVLLKNDNSLKTRAKAMAAAGSDARMSGCNLPVVINSGSGNQGLTASLPVVEYAKHYNRSHEELLRALCVSNLVTLHLKSGIGRLSAYCGAVSAGAGAGAGIAYMLTGDLRVINHTIVNALAITSGIVCDGAKVSCAAKIAMAVEAGIMGYDMFCEGCQFYSGDGLVVKGVESTIRNISALGHDGMKETDKKIIELMTSGC